MEPLLTREPRTGRFPLCGICLMAALLMMGGCGNGQPSPREGDAAAPSPQVDAGEKADALSAEAAADVIHEYYADLARGQYEAAWLQWSDSGRSSHQSLAEFKDGFAETRTTAVETGEPGRIEGAAGSRFVEVPVEIRATTRSGASQRFTGVYVLRRAVVDGATDTQRQWHIYRAEVELQPEP